MLFVAALALTSACTTIVTDPHPPTNVRSTPNGAVVTTLQNDTQLTVDKNRGSWLHVSAPVAGWVHLSVTSVTCGRGDTIAIVHRVRSLGELALHNELAADMLVRYAIKGDGGPGEEAYGGIDDLMRENPTLLISVLDQFDTTQRHDVLRTTVGMNPDAAGVRAFEHAIAAEPDHPTAATWNAMPASERAS